jgi:signal transduction histidine kinase
LKLLNVTYNISGGDELRGGKMFIKDENKLLNLLKNPTNDRNDSYIDTMKQRHQYRISVILVIAAMLIILPLLAWLQYTWLGQLSDEEYRRMMDNAQIAAFHCSMEISREVTECLRSIGGPVQGTDEAVAAEIRTRIREWKRSASHPGLLVGEVTVGHIPPADRYVSLMMDLRSTVFLFRDLSAIGIPVGPADTTAILVPLDHFVIATSILPDIIRKNVSSGMQGEYTIVVSDNAGNIFFRYPDTISVDTNRPPDFAMPLVLLPPSSPNPLTSPGPGPGRGPRDDRRPAPRESAPGDRRMDQRFSPPAGDREPPGEFRPNNQTGLFELQLRHRTGTLESTVNRNRIRSLIISFGVLLLLGLSVVFLLVSANRAQRLARQQLEFAASISHELRTPLAVVKSAAENLADGVIAADERTRKYGELIKKEILRLSEMVERALTYSGIQSGKQSYDFQILDCSEVIGRAVAKAMEYAGSSGVELRQAIATGLPPINGNPGALESAIGNILSNAVKYTTPGTAVTITARPGGPDSSRIEILVHDDGPGISPSDLPHIFEPFYRGKTAVESQIHGSGLGLSIATYLVQRHGGTITAESVKGHGTTFTISLPAAGAERGPA